jgi:hypothetical protein
MLVAPFVPVCDPGGVHRAGGEDVLHAGLGQADLLAVA